MAQYDDIPRIMELCEEARDIMREDGNMTQWTGGYPSEDVIGTDIDDGLDLTEITATERIFPESYLIYQKKVIFAVGLR